METLAYDRCRAVNELHMELAAGAQMIGWDICCLGLPASGDDFVQGEVQQHLEIEGVWLEHGRLQAEDRCLRESPLGLMGQPVVATMWCASGTPWAEAERQDLQEAALQAGSTVQAGKSAATDAVVAGMGSVAAHGVTSPNSQVVVLRALASRVEPVFDLFKAVRQAWHAALWSQDAVAPRLWRM